MQTYIRFRRRLLINLVIYLLKTSRTGICVISEELVFKVNHLPAISH